jgi:hypothetical protein
MEIEDRSVPFSSLYASLSTETSCVVFSSVQFVRTAELMQTQNT